MEATRSCADNGGVRSRYRPVVQTFFPIADDEEIELRSSLMFIRDSSKSKLRACSHTTRPFRQCLERLASHYAFAPMALPQLWFVRGTLIRMAAAVSSLEFVDQSSACTGR